MSESKIQVSFKLPNGTIPLFRGDTPEEVETLIQAAVVSETFIGSLEAFAEAAGIGRAPSAPQPVFQNQQAVANVAAALGGTVISETTTGSGPFRTCLHGRMTAMQGTSKFQAGEIYKSYMCPAPKGALDKCKSISIRKGTPEWDAFIPDKLAK
jgi:hypothetical protein